MDQQDRYLQTEAHRVKSMISQQFDAIKQLKYQYEAQIELYKREFVQHLDVMSQFKLELDLYENVCRETCKSYELFTKTCLNQRSLNNTTNYLILSNNNQTVTQAIAANTATAAVNRHGTVPNMYQRPLFPNVYPHHQPSANNNNNFAHSTIPMMYQNPRQTTNPIQTSNIRQNQSSTNHNNNVEITSTNMNHNYDHEMTTNVSQNQIHTIQNGATQISSNIQIQAPSVNNNVEITSTNMNQNHQTVNHSYNHEMTTNVSKNKTNAIHNRATQIQHQAPSENHNHVQEMASNLCQNQTSTARNTEVSNTNENQVSSTNHNDAKETTSNQTTTTTTHATSSNNNQSILSSNNISILSDDIKLEIDNDDDDEGRNDAMERASSISTISLYSIDDDTDVTVAKVVVSIKQDGRKKVSVTNVGTSHNGLIKCPVCPYISNKYCGIFNHFSSTHICKDQLNENLLQCHLCDRTINDYDQLMHHLKQHEKDNVYKCDHCDCLFKSYKSLAMHKKATSRNLNGRVNKT